MGANQLDMLWSTVVSIFLVGGMTGSMSGGWAADRLGRRGAIAISMMANLAAAVLFFTCKYAGSVELLLLARLVVGFASGESCLGPAIASRAIGARNLYAKKITGGYGRILLAIIAKD